MSQEENPSYEIDDIVWVKTDSYWWPGIVVRFDDLSKDVVQEARLRKRPLITVQYFDEDQYKFLHNNNLIFPYNCERKDDFIKKGLDDRNKLKDKFCRDVLTAEEKTDGDVNILSDPKFTPQKRVSLSRYLTENTPNGKKGRKSGRPSTSGTPTITHRRFLGKDDDFEMRDLIQTPLKKDANEDGKYRCEQCSFNSSKLEVFLMHRKWHRLNASASPKKPKTPRQRKPRKSLTDKSPTKAKDTSLMDDGAQKILNDWSDDENEENEPMNTSSTPIAKDTPVKSDVSKNDSCFDFHEEHEEKEVVAVTVTTRKKRGRKSKSKPPVEEVQNNESSEEVKEGKMQSDNDEFNKLLEGTTPLPDLEKIDKQQKDLLEKSDNNKEKAPAIATKLTNPKKRFVKSFEAFEMSLLRNEKEKLENEKLNSDEKAATKESKTESSNDESKQPDDEPKTADESNKDKADPLAALESSHAQVSEKIPPETTSNVVVLPPITTIEPRKTRRSSRLDKETKATKLPEPTVVAEKAPPPTAPRAEKAVTDDNKLEIQPEETPVKVDEPAPVPAATKATKRVTRRTRGDYKSRSESPKKEVKSPKRESPKKEIKSPRRDEIKSPRRDEIKSPIRSPRANDFEIKSPKRDAAAATTLKSPRRELIKSPLREPSPLKDDNKAPEIESPKAKVIKHQTGDASDDEDEVDKHVIAKEVKKVSSSSRKDLPDKATARSIARKIALEFSDDEPDSEEEEDEIPQDPLSKIAKLKSKLMTKLNESEPETLKKKETKNQPEDEAITTMEDEATTTMDKEDVNKKDTDKTASVVEKTDNDEKPKSESKAKDEVIQSPSIENEEEKPKHEIMDENLQEQPMEIEESASTTIHENDDMLLKTKELLDDSVVASITDLNSFESNDNDKQHESKEKNIRVVSESDLADRQVEIAKVPIIEEGTVKATTIASFSVDFGEEKEDAMVATKPAEEDNSNIVKEQLQEEEPTNISTSVEAEMAKINESITPDEPVLDLPHENTSSKLLEILTEHQAAKPVPTTQQSPKTKPTSVLKPAAAASSKVLLQHQTNLNKPAAKTIILSDKLVKSANQATSTTPKGGLITTVKKVKRPADDYEDVDAFVIQKPKKPALVVESKGGEALKIVGKKPSSGSTSSTPGVSKSKPTILGHTIITPSGEVINNKPQSSDDNVFDINSMPIVLDDQILTADAIEKMPLLMIQEDGGAAKASTSTTQQQMQRKLQQGTPIKLLNKAATPTTTTTTTIVKDASGRTHTIQPASKALLKTLKGNKVYHTNSTTLKNSPTIIQGNKPGKYVIIPSESSAPTGSKYTVGKRIIKKPPILQTKDSPTSGNKILLVTNQQGQQHRVLLNAGGTQQKMVGYHTTMKKGNLKTTLITSKQSPTPTYVTQTIINTKGQLTTTTQPVYASSPLTPVKKAVATATQLQQGKHKIIGQKVMVQNKPMQRTIIIKTPQGHTVKKVQTADDVPLEQQVAEQIEAINRASGVKLQQIAKPANTTTMKRIIRKSAGGVTENTKLAIQNKAQMILNTSVSKSAGVPPLAPITTATAVAQSKKAELIQQSKTIQSKATMQQQQQQKVQQTKVSASTSTAQATTAQDVKAADKPEEKRAPHQLVIQDALGNQTTITEGQILALPSETVDGQPQSYMLVTLDETGNLTPLNDDALKSLDPNLNLGGDLSNMVLQIDQGGGTVGAEQQGIESTTTTTTRKVVTESVQPSQQQEVIESPAISTTTIQQSVVESPVVTTTSNTANTNISTPPTTSTTTSSPAIIDPQQQQQQQQPDLNQMQAITCSINNGDTNKQLIITGDPISTQKFLESLSEGNTDITNLIAGAEGNILIHTDGQQILIHTDADNQMLMSLNDDATTPSSSQHEANPIFAAAAASAQPPATAKNQDILAAALADTDFQQEQSMVPSSKVTQSQLSPGSGLYPINVNVNNVLETSAMSSPIMTPLEVPSTNNKKINDEADILTPVPKNVDLPITITDPNIAQSVAHQQVALISNDIHSNLELPIAMQDVAAVTSAEMSSPSFGGYSLPTLVDDTEDVQKQFSSSISMPLLTDDADEAVGASESPNKSSTTEDNKTDTSAEYLLTSSALCSMSNATCGSLSEPPPDMFDFAMVDQNFPLKQEPSDELIAAPSVGDTSSTAGDETTVANQTTEFINKSDESSEIKSESLPTTNSETNSPKSSVDSMEIPVQKDIIADFNTISSDNKRSREEDGNGGEAVAGAATTDEESESKKCKFDTWFGKKLSKDRLVNTTTCSNTSI